MKKLENLINDVLRAMKYYPVKQDQEITFDDYTGTFTIVGEFKITDYNIPMENLAGRKKMIVIVSLDDLHSYYNYKKFCKMGKN
jgi:hypothetical protein